MGRKRNEKNNFQDESETREYNKGKRAGRNQANRGKKKPFNAQHENPGDIFKDRDTGKTVEQDRVMPIVLKGSNDDSWHVPSQALAESTARISMHLADGTPVSTTYCADEKEIAEGINIATRRPISVPGIMAFEVFNGPGKLDNATDPFNVGGQLVFNYMQRLTGRAPAYEQAQVCMYLFALTSAYGLYQWMTRIYGTMNSRNLESRYLPQALVIAMGGNYNDLSANMANFRTMINQFALDLGALPLPNNITYCNWYLNQFETVYKDSDTNKAQLYLFKPHGFFKWVEADPENPITYLDFFTFRNYWLGNTQTVGMEGMRKLINDIMQPLLSSQDIRLIGSDILNSFGNDLFSVYPIAETYTVEPEYNEEMSSVIENAYMYGVNGEVYCRIREDATINGGTCIADFSATPQGLSGLTNQDKAQVKNDPFASLQTDTMLFNWHKNEAPEPGRLLTVTRYSGIGWEKPVMNSGGQIQYYEGVRAGAYNLITHTNMYSMVQTQTGVELGVQTLSSLMVVNVDSMKEDVINVMSTLTMWSKFDWAPAIRVVSVQNKSTDPSSLNVLVWLSDKFCDIDNFAEIPIEMLENLNRVSMTGEFLPRGLGGYSPVS